MSEVKDVDVDYELRLCRLCNSGEVESLLHFIMYCSCFKYGRSVLLDRIKSSLSVDGINVWEALGDLLKVKVMLGLVFPFSTADLSSIRTLSCIHIHKMYKIRMLMENH